MPLDKIVLKFLADVLYVKEIINIGEYDDILDSRNGHNLDEIIDKMLGGDYIALHKKGESYTLYGK